MIRIKRAYDPPDAADGCRILVDRIWPRGLSKEKAGVDLWIRDVAPSSGLRKWFGHRPERWAEFKERYHRELDDLREPLETLRSKIGGGPATLVFAAKDEEHNNAAALRDYLSKRKGRKRKR